MNESVQRRISELKEQYNSESEVCMAEFLASEMVGEFTFEEAIEVYASLMNWAENDIILRTNKDEGWTENIVTGVRYNTAINIHKFILKETEKADPDYSYKKEFNTLEEAQRKMKREYRRLTGGYENPPFESAEINERSALVVLNDGNEIEWDIEEIEI